MQPSCCSVSGAAGLLYGGTAVAVDLMEQQYSFDS